MASQSNPAARPLGEAPAENSLMDARSPEREPASMANEYSLDDKPNCDAGYLDRFIPVLLRSLSAWNV